MPNANRDKGIRAELALASYLRGVWRGAERSVATGVRNIEGRDTGDRGDIRGTGTRSHPLVWQCKSVGKSHPGGLAGVALGKLLTQTREQRDNAGAVLGVLVEKRPGRGYPADWWAHLGALELGILVTGRSYPVTPVPHPGPPVRLELGDLLPALVSCGFADRDR